MEPAQQVWVRPQVSGLLRFSTPVTLLQRRLCMYTCRPLHGGGACWCTLSHSRSANQHRLHMCSMYPAGISPTKTTLLVVDVVGVARRERMQKSVLLSPAALCLRLRLRPCPCPCPCLGLLHAGAVRPSPAEEEKKVNEKRKRKQQRTAIGIAEEERDGWQGTCLTCGRTDERKKGKESMLDECSRSLALDSWSAVAFTHALHCAPEGDDASKQRAAGCVNGRTAGRRGWLDAWMAGRARLGASAPQSLHRRQSQL